MSDRPQGFLGRWAGRKAASRPAPAEPALPQLPPIESLGPASDFAVFLQRGVTAELQRQALAVAWRSDPVIAGFRGMADYDWDFNAPGYGKLAAADDVARLLRAVLSPSLAEPEAPAGAPAEIPALGVAADTLHPPHQPARPASHPAGESATLTADQPVPGPPAQVAPASPAALPVSPGPVIRRHGRALPT